MAKMYCRVAKASKNDKFFTIRFGKGVADHFKLESGQVYEFHILHSDGVVVKCVGRVTQARDKAYLNGCGTQTPYHYETPELGDSRPVELVKVLEGVPA